MLIWYHNIAMSLCFSYIPKNVQISRVGRHNDIIIAEFAQFCNFQWHIGQNWIFCQKSSKYRNFFGFLLIKEGNDVSNIYCKIQDHTIKIFFKIVIFNIAGLHPTPSPSDFDGLLYPGVRWYPKLFFIKMTTRDVKEIT